MVDLAASSFAHIPVRPAWLASTAEEALDPDLEIVDAHHHLWDRPTGTYLYPDLREDTQSGHRIVATVYVQCRSMYRLDGPVALRPLGEVEFANGVAAMAASGTYGETRAGAAIVACVDLTLGDEVDGVIEAMLAATPRVRGIRFPVAYHSDPVVASSPASPPAHLLIDPKFAAGASRLVRHGLTLDVWAYQTQLAEVLQLSETAPDLTIVLDHCGGPVGVGDNAGRRREAYGHWYDQMARLARQPNVHVKLGGLGMRVGGFDFHLLPAAPSSETLAHAWAPYLDACIDLFGVERCLFESNFPVDKGMVSYANLWNAFKRVTAKRSTAERRALFADTAKRLYSLR